MGSKGWLLIIHANKLTGIQLLNGYGSGRFSSTPFLLTLSLGNHKLHLNRTGADKGCLPDNNQTRINRIPPKIFPINCQAALVFSLHFYGDKSLCYGLLQIIF